MEKNNNTLLIVIATLVLGLVLGYMLAGNRMSSRPISNGTHMMPDGSMMANGGSMDMDDMMESMNAQLRGKTGDSFDVAFLEEMIVHHEGAVEMAKLAQTNAKHQEIKDLAAGIISAQNTEIIQMRSWLKAWYR